jgi:hypothetical protein
MQKIVVQASRLPEICRRDACTTRKNYPMAEECVKEKILTIFEIQSSYLSEWILLNVPQTNDAGEVLGSNVLHHSPDRDEVYRKAVELRPKHFAVLFTGTIPDGTEVVL